MVLVLVLYNVIMLPILFAFDKKYGGFDAFEIETHEVAFFNTIVDVSATVYQNSVALSPGIS